MKAMKVKASLKNYRKSAQKVREVANIIRGVMVSEAEIMLSGIKKESAEEILKLLKSAVANAENNFKLNKKDLFISEIIVNEGMVLKRWRARAYGRAARILKRSCHVNIVLEAVTAKIEVSKKKSNQDKKKDLKSVKAGKKKVAGKKIDKKNKKVDNKI